MPVKNNIEKMAARVYIHSWKLMVQGHSQIQDVSYNNIGLTDLTTDLSLTNKINK